MIFDLHPLGAVRRDGKDPGTERCRVAGFVGATFTLLQKAGIDPLGCELVVDLFRAFALQDHCRDPSEAVPYREIRNGGSAGKRKDVISFLNTPGMVGEDLADENASVAIVDANVDLHLFQRQYVGIRLRASARNQHACVAVKERGDEAE